MSTAFTDPTHVDWAAASFLNEIHQGVIERYDAVFGYEESLGDTIGAEIAAGNDVQAAALFEAWQDAIEEMAVLFVDHTHNGGDFTGEENPTRFDLETFAAAAGLTYPGLWRAYTVHPDDDGEPAYRQIQAGDIIGPWLFEDLQAALTALKWTYTPASLTAVASAYGWGSDDDMSTAKQAAIDSTAAEGSANPYGHVEASVAYTGVPMYTAERRGTQVECAPYWAPEDLVPALDYDWDLYLLTGALYTGAEWDDAGLGLTEGWNRLQPTAQPHCIGTAGEFPSWPSGGEGDRGAVLILSPSYAIVRWDWTHSGA